MNINLASRMNKFVNKRFSKRRKQAISKHYV